MQYSRKLRPDCISSNYYKKFSCRREAARRRDASTVTDGRTELRQRSEQISRLAKPRAVKKIQELIQYKITTIVVASV